MTQALAYNPDVLSCLANLSSDEVFTPPALANQMLDLLPSELWSNPDAKFLDPCCKTGVFLREITRRLNEGLKDQMPQTQERVNHILTRQVHGMAITELTALISRRSVYCSKWANGDKSICTAFANEQGHIIHQRLAHTWVKGRCAYCGASEEILGREEDLETHAYALIHMGDEEIRKGREMKFDVIIGNPPYQLRDGGTNASATPIYQKFVEQAIRLNPMHLCMIIPSRWFGGGKGLDEFRRSMLTDRRIKSMVDYEDASECFPGVDIAGGVCYFHWERNYSGKCEFKNIKDGAVVQSQRDLSELSILVRHSQALSIIEKVKRKSEECMSAQVSSSKPFGLRTFVRPLPSGDISLRWQKGVGPYKRSEITTGLEMIDVWKVITSYVGYDHAGNPGKDGKRKVFSKIDVLPPGTICNETYLVIGAYKSEAEAKNLVAYMKTRFFRFLVSQFMFSHHITKDAYAYVPVLDMKQHWTDEQLYKRYRLSAEDIQFIESKIRPMPGDREPADDD